MDSFKTDIEKDLAVTQHIVFIKNKIKVTFFILNGLGSSIIAASFPVSCIFHLGGAPSKTDGED